MLVISLSTLVACEALVCSDVHVCCHGKEVWLLLSLEGRGGQHLSLVSLVTLEDKNGWLSSLDEAGGSTVILEDEGRR